MCKYLSSTFLKIFKIFFEVPRTPRGKTCGAGKSNTYFCVSLGYFAMLHCAYKG